MTNPAALLSIDTTPGGVDNWAFNHARDHDVLAAACAAAGSPILYQILDPIGDDLDQWLLDHQRAHNDLGGVTGVNNSDLQTVDFSNPSQRQAWLQINQQEHTAFAAVLGIAA